MSDVHFEAMDLMLGNQVYGTYGEETINWKHYVSIQNGRINIRKKILGEYKIWKK